MKNLMLIIHTDVQQDLTDQLHTIEQISGFTFSHVEGQGIYCVTSVEKTGQF